MNNLTFKLLDFKYVLNTFYLLEIVFYFIEQLLLKRFKVIILTEVKLESHIIMTGKSFAVLFEQKRNLILVTEIHENFPVYNEETFNEL